jgi:hypothetical protein
VRLNVATIGDFVWSDLDGDGVQDAGEPGIGGVTLALWSDAGGAPGSIVMTTTTDAAGAYLFNVAPGSYFVDVTDAGGVLADKALTSGPNSKSDPFGPLTVTAGEAYRSADFGYAIACAPTKAAIGGTVWLDADRNGQLDAGEAGLAGVSVCATPLGYPGSICAQTDSAGAYRLCVPKHTYLVAPITVPAGLTRGSISFRMPLVCLPGQKYLDLNFNFFKP